MFYQGKSEGGVYSIYPHRASHLSLSSKVYNNVARLASFNKSLWHMRLCHHYDQVLKVLIPIVKSILNKCTSIDSSCTHCLYGKMPNLPFLNLSLLHSILLSLSIMMCGVLHLFLR